MMSYSKSLGTEMSPLQSYLVGGSSLAGKSAWVLSRGLPTKNADYCMFINEWAWLRSQVCLYFLNMHLASILNWRAQSELKIAFKAHIC